MPIIPDTSITEILSSDDVVSEIANAPHDELKAHIDDLNTHHDDDLIHSGDLTMSGGEIYLESGRAISTLDNVSVTPLPDNTVTSILGTGDFLISTFNSPDANSSGLAFDGTHMASSDGGVDKIFIHSGITSTITDSYASPGPTGQVLGGLAFDNSGNLISAGGSSPNKIYTHSGNTSTITSSFNYPSGNGVQGLFVDSSNNLISLDSTEHKILKHSGITDTITDSWTIPGHLIVGAVPRERWDASRQIDYHGIYYDGTYFYIATNAQLLIFDGITSTCIGQTEYSGAITTTWGIFVHDNQLVKMDYAADDIEIYNWNPRFVKIKYNTRDIDGTLRYKVDDGVDHLLTSSFEDYIFVAHKIEVERYGVGAIWESGVPDIISSFDSPATYPSGMTWDTTNENLISCDRTADKIYVHSGFAAVITDSFASATANPQGLTIDGSGNLISCVHTAAKIYQHSGITSTITTSFSSPGGVPSGLTFDNVNTRLISCDSNTEKIYVHVGVSTTIVTSFTTPGTYVSGLVMETLGGNNSLVSLDSQYGTVYVHSGVTSTIISSYFLPSPIDDTYGLAFDGKNIMFGDNVFQKIYKSEGDYYYNESMYVEITTD